MSTLNIQPLIESAILTLEQILENKTEIANIDLDSSPENVLIYGDHKQIIYLRCGLCSNINENQIKNLDLHPHDPRITEFEFMFDELTTEWPESSGSNGYPVPMPEHFTMDWEGYSEPDKKLDEHDEEEKAYAAYHISVDENVNMYAGDYGELRFQLAEFVLGKLKEKLHVRN